MGYYDDDYEEVFEYDGKIEPVSLLIEECSEKELTDALMTAGLINETAPKFVGTMEKLVFMYGDSKEVYSSDEIRFIERVKEVFVYPDFFKSLNKGNMACRVIAVKFSCSGYDALKACVSFEKIVDKALDSFNIFFFVTDESVFFGCRIFDKIGHSDCILSSPIHSEIEFEQIQEDLSFLSWIDDFIDYYNQYRYLITVGHDNIDDYDEAIMRRQGIQMSYLEAIDRIGRNFGIDVSKEKERYCKAFEEETEMSFASLLEEVEDSLSFIKSNRINTYEMLFDADEMMRQAEEVETENNRLVQQTDLKNYVSDSLHDEEKKELLEDPEEMIKILKKERGI